MGTQRRRHSSKFKKQVALEAIREQKTLSELSSEFSIHPNQIITWKKQLIDGVEDIFKDKRKKGILDKEETESKLYEEIGRLKIELDWFKKKSGI